mmetsp:Transcript_23010/g.50508  ORF Transcript_23010/g.50508 Transcript_23010/m.50508 type:complete len:221 (+) Transcript_23010:685-1347(+)
MPQAAQDSMSCLLQATVLPSMLSCQPPQTHTALVQTYMLLCNPFHSTMAQPLRTSHTLATIMPTTALRRATMVCLVMDTRHSSSSTANLLEVVPPMATIITTLKGHTATLTQSETLPSTSCLQSCSSRCGMLLLQRECLAQLLARGPGQHMVALVRGTLGHTARALAKQVHMILVPTMSMWSPVPGGRRMRRRMTAGSCTAGLTAHTRMPCFPPCGWRWP